MKSMLVLMTAGSTLAVFQEFRVPLQWDSINRHSVKVIQNNADEETVAQTGLESQSLTS